MEDELGLLKQELKMCEHLTPTGQAADNLVKFTQSAKVPSRRSLTPLPSRRSLTPLPPHRSLHATPLTPLPSHQEPFHSEANPADNPWIGGKGGGGGGCAIL